MRRAATGQGAASCEGEEPVAGWFWFAGFFEGAEVRIKVTPLDWHRAMLTCEGVTVGRVHAVLPRYVHTQIVVEGGDGISYNREGQVNYYDTDEGDRTYTFISERRYGCWHETGKHVSDAARPPLELLAELVVAMLGS